MKLVQVILHHVHKLDVSASVDEESMVLLFLAGSGRRREDIFTAVVPAKPTHTGVRHGELLPVVSAALWTPGPPKPSLQMQTVTVGEKLLSVISASSVMKTTEVTIEDGFFFVVSAFYSGKMHSSKCRLKSVNTFLVLLYYHLSRVEQTTTLVSIGLSQTYEY